MQRPRILCDYLYRTGQYAHEPLSDAHLLNEAEWCYYNATQNEASVAFNEYHGNSKRALKRYIDKLRAQGVKPKRDFD